MPLHQAKARLPLQAIQIRHQDQYAQALDYVADHPHDYEDALDSEPVDVELDRGVYWLEDGHHRFVTAQLRGDSEINATVFERTTERDHDAAVTSEDEIIYETLGRGIHNKEHLERMRKDLEDAGFSQEKIKEVLGSTGQTYYHASPHELDYFLDFTALAPDPDDALGYLRDKPGYLHVVTIKPGLKIADEDDIKQAADSLDDPLLEQEDFVFTLADHDQVRDVLETQGFEAMRYEDVGPDNMYEHDTLVVFDGDDIELLDTKPVDHAVDVGWKEATNQGSVRASLDRDRDAGAAEIELERLFRALLPDTKFEGKVFAVGGYVRDQLQHREPADLDMVVEMPYGAQRFVGFLLDQFPTQLSDPAPLTYAVPIWNMHFTADVQYAGETYSVRGAEIDVTDTQTLDQLDDALSTSYGPISDDVLRRDYTVNMLYKDLTSGKILDPTGVGQSDIERGLLRARPDEDIVRAFHEQPKRMLRLVRFMAQYGWEPDPAIEAGLHEAVGALAEVSGHSLQKEFNKLKKRGILDKTLHFMREYGMLAPIRQAWKNREKA